MNLRFVVRLAAREARATRKRLGFYAGAVTLGVAALVAINGFRTDVARAVRSESRGLLGADLELHARQPFPDSIQALLDSARAAGTPVATVTSFGSMALAPRGRGARLVEVRAVDGGYPFYGTIETQPGGRWARLQGGHHALVDPAVLIQLDASVGDTLRIGESAFEIDGVLTRVPGEIGLRAALGPRVYIPAQYLGETGLLRFGSRARYAAYLALPDGDAVQRFINRHNRLFGASRVGYDTAAERERDLTHSLDLLGRYLGLVGLIALLLGGIGVASAVHVFVRDKLDTVAVLRCIGAEQSTMFATYLLQATGLGVSGAAAGIALGLAVQYALPHFLADVLPVPVAAALDWGVVLTGLALGTWVAVAFALLPLLDVRNVPPLRALRRDHDLTRPRDPWRLVTAAAIVGTVTGVSLWQAPRVSTGLGFAGALVATGGALWLVARGLMACTRRYFPRRAPYVVRQGVANLFRPRNQTVAVTLAVGFGIFLLGSLEVVRRNLLDQLRVDRRPDRPNLVIFDIQRDQRDSVEAALRRSGAPVLQTTPIVPSRIAAVNGRSVEALLSDTTGPRRPHWPLRREYRNTYRDTLVGSETVVAGTWHGEAGAAGRTPTPISVERGLAEELGVVVGDRITWDVQGVQVTSVVTSLREVDWARFEPNFFVVFATGALERAPQTFVTLTRVAGTADRARLTRDLVLRYANLSAVDLSQVIETLDTILGTVALAVRFMALFSIAAGALVLVGAVATARFQRLRESVLLKTLGARARQVRRILLAEYVALGTLAGLAGTGLAAVGGWALVQFVFDLPFHLPLGSLVLFTASAAALTVVVGLLGSRDVLRKPPLAVIREMGE